MKKTASGSCLCGQIKFEYFGQFGPSSYCHCDDCKKVTGSAYLVSIRFDVKDFRIVSGNNKKSFSKVSDRGNEIIRDFCQNCGSPLFTFSPHHPDFIWVKAGSLDDFSIVKPTHQSWMDSKVDWANIPDNIRSYSKSCNLLK